MRGYDGDFHDDEEETGMHISELRIVARALREEMYQAQEEHPQVGVLQELVACCNGLDHNLYSLEIGQGDPTATAALIRTGWVLGRMHVLATIAVGRFTTRKLVPLRPKAERWVDRTRELVDLLPTVELPVPQLEEVPA